MKLNFQNTRYTSRNTRYKFEMRSTPVENVRQISPFYAKQSQSQVCQNQHKHFCNNEIHKYGQLVIQTKQSQFKPNKAKNKPNKAKNKPNLSQYKANSNPIKANFTNLKGAEFNMLFLTNRQKFDRIGSNSKWLNPR